MTANGHTPKVTLTLANLVLTGTSSCLSILGAFLIFVTYFKIPAIQNFTRRLLVCLTIADLLTAIGNLLATVRYAIVHMGDVSAIVTKHCNTTSNDTSVTSTSTWDSNDDLHQLCVLQSFVTTFSNLSSYFWTFIIALHIWSSVMYKTTATENYILNITYHITSWVVPLILVCVAVIKGYLGEDFCFGTGIWCGIRSNLDTATIQLWMYIVDIGWQLACYLSTCLLYMHIKLYIKLKYKNRSLKNISNNLRNEDKNFIFVWLIIYLLKIWGIVRFFIATYAPTDQLSNNTHLQRFMDFLLLMQSYGASGQAFWNCILFCFLDKTVRYQMKSWIWKQGKEEKPLLKHKKYGNREMSASDSV